MGGPADYVKEEKRVIYKAPSIFQPLAITADPQVMAAVKELADPRTDVDAERRREQIDRVLTHGAEWGWSMARAGL